MHVSYYRSQNITVMLKENASFSLNRNFIIKEVFREFGGNEGRNTFTLTPKADLSESTKFYANLPSCKVNEVSYTRRTRN